MGIAVHCQCGKKFKVKECLAGKAIRCPKCKQPLRVRGPKGGSAVTTNGERNKKGRGKTPKIDKEAAILRFERAQDRKEKGAEVEAAYREEQNKLIESYDQLTGRKKKGKKKKKKELAGGKRRKPTIFMLLADAWGIITGTLFFKYLVIIVLFSAGALGSIYGVSHLWSYSHGTTTAAAPLEVQREELFKTAEAAIEAKKWSEANKALIRLYELNPLIEKNRHYRELKKQVEVGFEGD